MFPVMLYIYPWLGRAGEFLHSLALKMHGVGLMLVAIADSSFLSIPEGNDVLIVVLATGNTWKTMAYFVTMTIAGSVTGCLLLYTVGRKGGSPLLRRRFSEKNIERAERLFEKYGILTVVIPSILPPPCPFKIFVLSAGVFRLKTLEFFTAVVIGRTIRYSIWGILAVLYGNAVKTSMQKNLPALGLALFGVFLLVIGITAMMYGRRLRAGRRGV
jgi:membrane protein YqaA with SNARE-associated domain